MCTNRILLGTRPWLVALNCAFLVLHVNLKGAKLDLKPYCTSPVRLIEGKSQSLPRKLAGPHGGSIAKAEKAANKAGFSLMDTTLGMPNAVLESSWSAQNFLQKSKFALAHTLNFNSFCGASMHLLPHSTF